MTCPARANKLGAEEASRLDDSGIDDVVWRAAPNTVLPAAATGTRPRRVRGECNSIIGRSPDQSGSPEFLVDQAGLSVTGLLIETRLTARSGQRRAKLL